MPFGGLDNPKRPSRVNAVIAGFIVTLLLLIFSGVLSVWCIRFLDQQDQAIQRTQEVIVSLEMVLSTLKDAETGQRGLLLTNDERYKGPYLDASRLITSQLDELEGHLDSTNQRQRLTMLRQKVESKLAELAFTVSLHDRGDREGAMRVVQSDVGQAHMESIRQIVAEMRTEEQDQLEKRQLAATRSYWIVLYSVLFTTAASVGLTMMVFFLLFRNLRLRDKALERIAEERERLRVTLASIGDAVIVTDHKGCVRFTNAVADELTGWGKEAHGLPLRDVFHIVNEYTGAEVESPVDKVLRVGKVVGLANHTILISRDGSRRPIDDSGAPVRGSNGEIEGVVLVFRDVSERREQENILHESHQLFRQLADAMPQIVWVTAPDGRVEFFNKRWFEYVGGNESDSMGHQWSALLHPDDRDRTVEHWEKCWKTGTPYEIEYRLASEEGEYHWFLARGLPVRNDAGEIIRWFGTCTDINVFKATALDRERFVSLAEYSHDFVAIFDSEGKPTYINHSGLQLVGLESIEAAADLSVVDFCVAEDRPRIAEEFLPAVYAQGHAETEVRFCNAKTGTTRWMIFSLFTLPGEEQQPIAGLATVSRDITERRQLEDDLRRLAADLSEAGRRKDEFLATLAHELRNPLAPIRNGLQLMKLASNSGQVVEQARAMMERQLLQMVRLVDDLLDVSRITRNKLELRRASVELQQIVASALETSRPVIEANRHELQLELPAESIILEADETRLAQVFANLLNNAAKYTPPGGHIELRAEKSSDKVNVIIRDNGVGIAHEKLPLIFEMFTQIDRTVRHAEGGLGIGLTLAKRLVELHGGQILAASEGSGK